MISTHQKGQGMEFKYPDKEITKEYAERLTKLIEWHQSRVVTLENELMKLGVPFVFIPAESGVDL